MKFLLLLTLIFTQFIFASAQVFTAGKAKNVMMGTDLSAHVKLDTLLTRAHLYALGPIDDLQGEITVINGIPLSSTIIEGEIITSIDSNAKAPFMAYAYVENWQKINITQPISNLKELEKFVAELALKQGINTNEPFPFLISGQVDFIAFHIIMRDKNEAEHNHDKHNAAKVRFERKENQAILLGFYSTHHEGVFTHKDQFIHLHYTDADYSENGHVDAITLSLFTIWLPK